LVQIARRSTRNHRGMARRQQPAPTAQRARLPDPRRVRRCLACPACRARQAGSNHLRYVQQHGLYELILGTKKGVRSPVLYGKLSQTPLSRYTPLPTALSLQQRPAYSQCGSKLLASHNNRDGSMLGYASDGMPAAPSLIRTSAMSR
jgi:hypothetical protein